ncbi:MAG: PIN domain-containing protein [Acidobacteriota bacterium]|nr:PIN domain-containing protein [Acidobacteriota bacterium]
MIVVDANILIYAYNTAVEQHATARRWLEDAFSGEQRVALPWSVIHAFLRVTTNEKILPSPLSIQSAVSIVEDWRAVTNVRIIQRGPRYWQIMRELLIHANARGNLVTDVDVAAITIENDATLYTNDRDFARFPGLRTINPLA